MLNVEDRIFTKDEWDQIHHESNVTESGHYKISINLLPKLFVSSVIFSCKHKGVDPINHCALSFELSGYLFFKENDDFLDLTSLIESAGFDPYGRIPFESFHGVHVSFENCLFEQYIVLSDPSYSGRYGKHISTVGTFKNCRIEKINLKFGNSKGFVFLFGCSIGHLCIKANQDNFNIDLSSLHAFNVGSKINISGGDIGVLEVSSKKDKDDYKKNINAEIKLDNVIIDTLNIYDVYIISVFVIDNCYIKKCARIHERVSLSYYTVFMNSTFSASYENLSFFRIIRRKFQEIGNEYEAQYFLSYELEAQKNFLSKLIVDGKKINRKVTKSEKVELILAKVYHVFNQFGRDLYAPLCWLFIFWIMVANVSYLFDLFIFDDSSAWMRGVTQSNNFSFYAEVIFNLVYAFKLILGPAGIFFDMQYSTPKNLFSMFFSAFVQISSTLIWFLYLLQIKKRFSIK